jgi:hypothetical protein
VLKVERKTVKETCKATMLPTTMGSDAMESSGARKQQSYRILDRLVSWKDRSGDLYSNPP